MITMIRRLAVPVLVSAMVVGCQVPMDTGPTSKPLLSSDATPIQREALDVGQRVSQWQVAQIEQGNYDYIPQRFRRVTQDAKGWIQAAFYVGLTQWVQRVSDPDLTQHITDMAYRERYSLLMRRIAHADDHAIAQSYLWIAEQSDNTQAYQLTQKHFDRILAEHNPELSLEMIEQTEKPRVWGYEGLCQDRWCWADALFMSPRAWLKMTNITGDPKYFEHADKEFWATVDYLFTDEYGLFYRDSRYFDKVSDNGKPVFWSRGNGWVFASLPLLINDMPIDHPSRKRYIDLFKRNAEGLVNIQKPDGYWAASLLDPDKVKTPEVSGTGFITFGLAWGVNEGLLTAPKYIQAVEMGWQALEAAVQPSGRVNWVQQIGKSPDPVQESDTQLYGVGAVLLAASEMVRWSN